MAAVPGRVQSIVVFLNVDAAGCCGDALGASAEDADLQARVKAVVQRLGIPPAVPTGGSDHQVFAPPPVPAAPVHRTPLPPPPPPRPPSHPPPPTTSRPP